MESLRVTKEIHVVFIAGVVADEAVGFVEAHGAVIIFLHAEDYGAGAILSENGVDSHFQSLGTDAAAATSAINNEAHDAVEGDAVQLRRVAGPGDTFADEEHADADIRAVDGVCVPDTAMLHTVAM